MTWLQQLRQKARQWSEDQLKAEDAPEVKSDPGFLSASFFGKAISGECGKVVAEIMRAAMGKDAQRCIRAEGHIGQCWGKLGVSPGRRPLRRLVLDCVSAWVKLIDSDETAWFETVMDSISWEGDTFAVMVSRSEGDHNSVTLSLARASDDIGVTHEVGEDVIRNEDDLLGEVARDMVDSLVSSGAKAGLRIREIDR